jgi:hypothetical protein
LTQASAPPSAPASSTIAIRWRVRAAVLLMRVALAAELAVEAATLFRDHRFEGSVLWTVTPSHGLAVGDVLGALLVLAAIAVLLPLVPRRHP